MKGKDYIQNFFGIIIIIFVVLGIYSMMYTVYQEDKKDRFCIKNYPSEVNTRSAFDPDEYASNTEVEEGYVKCCRRIVLPNHEYDTECEVMLYE